MPVELTNFTASVKNNSVELLWNTATETNNSRFEVEKKIENFAWLKIGSIPGNGTSTKSHSYRFVDANSTFNHAFYRLRQVDLDGSYSYSKTIEVTFNSPSNYELAQNYPNPFNPTTTITYNLPVSSKVKLEIFSITGQLVKVLVDENKEAGKYSINFNGSSLASGTYIYRLMAGGNIITRKMILLK